MVVVYPEPTPNVDHVHMSKRFLKLPNNLVQFFKQLSVNGDVVDGRSQVAVQARNPDPGAGDQDPQRLLEVLLDHAEL